MPTTEHIHLPLYTDEETPDLSTTGHYNHAMEILDANVGELEARDAELAEGLADERKARTDADTALDTAYKAADTALGSRIDNAETEISANSADLTGIKGLTYGAQHVNFIESSNGEYSSPALDEIQHEISDLQNKDVGTDWYTLTIERYSGTLTPDVLAQLKSHWPHVMVSVGGINLLYPKQFIAHTYTFLSVIPSTRGANYAHGLSVNGNTGEHSDADTYYAPRWDKVTQKPFSTIGSGLKVVSDALTVDTAAIPTGITANTTFGDLTTGVTS
jgi:hypothetical protein